MKTLDLITGKDSLFAERSLELDLQEDGSVLYMTMRGDGQSTYIELNTEQIKTLREFIS